MQYKWDSSECRQRWKDLKQKTRGLKVTNPGGSRKLVIYVTSEDLCLTCSSSISNANCSGTAQHQFIPFGDTPRLILGVITEEPWIFFGVCMQWVAVSSRWRSQCLTCIIGSARCRLEMNRWRDLLANATKWKEPESLLCALPVPYACFLLVSTHLMSAQKRKEISDSGMIFFCPGVHREVDMAILAQCDALVLSTGTFSWWSGFLNQKSSQVSLFPSVDHYKYQHSKIIQT